MQCLVKNYLQRTQTEGEKEITGHVNWIKTQRVGELLYDIVEFHQLFPIADKVLMLIFNSIRKENFRNL